MSTAKRNSLILLFFALLLILGLAMGLPSLILSPGQPFSLGSGDDPGAGGMGPLIGDNVMAWIIRGIWVLTLICIPLYIFISLFTPEGRKRLKRNILTIIIILFLLQFIPDTLENAGVIEEIEETAIPESADIATAAQPTAVFSPDPPTWISVMTVIFAAVLISSLIIALLIFFRKRKARQKSSLEKLAGEAQTAMDAIRAGRDFKSTIIRCYQEMMRVVEEEKGIARETAMTPREFESNLISKGLPQDPIKIITRLFENVRYGNLPIDDAEEKLAFASLSEIVKVCQSLGVQHEIKQNSH